MSPFVDFSAHNMDDLLPYAFCCRGSMGNTRCDFYNMLRPSRLLTAEPYELPVPGILVYYYTEQPTQQKVLFNVLGFLEISVANRLHISCEKEARVKARGQGLKLGLELGLRLYRGLDIYYLLEHFFKIEGYTGHLHALICSNCISQHVCLVTRTS